MSEFSESAHLRSNNPEEAIDLLRRAKVAGYVFPASNGWVSFVYSQGTRIGDSENRFRLEEANKGTLLFYDYAGDHGCWVTLHEGKKPVGRIKASFERPNAAFDRAPFERLGLLSTAGASAIDAWVKRAHVWHERSRVPHLVAERLGLPRYRWLSYSGQLTIDEPDPKRIEVSSNGTVRRPLAPPKPHVAAPQPKKKTKAAAKKKKTAAKKKTRAR